MKMNRLTTAVVAGIAGVAGVGGIADAVNMNHDGLGQVLIYPYYTTQGGNDTLLTVVNTADVGKAVKVRFLEGRNSREVLDFHLYLSPWDVWTGAVINHGDGAGVFVTDRSCTVPDIARGGLGFDGGRVTALGDGYIARFVNNAYGRAPAVDAASLSGLGRTREGYVEIIEMGNLDPDANPHVWAEHVDGEPGSCLNLNRAWFTSAGIWGGTSGNPASGLLPPDGTGHLFGNALIINPSAGTVSGYAADAIEGFTYALLHERPGSVNPGLDRVNNPAAEGGNLFATAYVFQGGHVFQATYDAAVSRGKVDAITALYASPRVINEYFLDETDSVTFDSEWVINFPTKRFYVDTRPGVEPPGAPFVAAVRAPFVDAFRADGTGSCHEVVVNVWDREEDTFEPTGGGFSPPDPGPDADSLCWEAQVVTFNQSDRVGTDPTAILGSTYYKNIDTEYQHGWAAISFVNHPTLRPSVPLPAIGDLGGVVFDGLPVTGFFVTNANNGVIPNGTLANYSALFRHRTERSITVAS